MNVPRTKLQEALERFDANPPADYLAWKKKLRRKTNFFLVSFMLASSVIFFLYALMWHMIFSR